MHIIKNCAKHGALFADDIRIDTWGKKVYRRCKKCVLERSRRYEARVKQIPEKVIAKKQRRASEWRRNKERIMQERQTTEYKNKRKEWRERNKERLNPIFREKQKSYRENLADPHIRKLIQNGDKKIRIADIPKSLVDLKRSLLLLKKGIKKSTETRMGDRVNGNKEHRGFEKSYFRLVRKARKKED